MPGMLPDNNAPWWGPGRPMIVSDPNKLTYFARANAVRAGVMGSAGALHGIGDDLEQGGSSLDELYNGPVSMGNRLTPTSIATGSAARTTATVETPSGGSSLERFFSSFNSFLTPAPVTFPAAKVTPSPWPWLVGAAAVGVGLIVLSKKASHR